MNVQNFRYIPILKNLMHFGKVEVRENFCVDVLEVLNVHMNEIYEKLTTIQ